MSLDITNQHLIWWNYNEAPKVIEVNKEWLLINSDVWLEISRWTITWISALNKFWLNESVWITEETIWDYGGMYTFLSSASILDIQSDNANDDLTWTGARTIIIYWLDSDYNEISEIIELDWINTVNTTNSYLRVYRMSVVTAWSWWEAEGTITAEVSGVVYAQIVNWNNQTLMWVYTIPAWKTWYLIYWKSWTWKWKEVLIKFKIRPLWWVFNVWHVAYVYEGTYDYRFNPPLAIPEKTDLMVTGTNVWAWSIQVSAVFDLILIDNN